MMVGRFVERVAYLVPSAVLFMVLFTVSEFITLGVLVGLAVLFDFSVPDVAVATIIMAPGFSAWLVWWWRARARARVNKSS